MKFIMWPGDFVADMTGLEADSENRQVLRMFTNTVFYSLVSLFFILSFV